MNIERINDYIDAYSGAINMPLEYIKVLKELMPKIIQRYEKVMPYITVEQDNYDKYVIKPTNGKYTTEDFFLNRLMRNVWNIDLNAPDKGDYDPPNVTIRFNENKIKKQLEGLINNKSEQELSKIKETAEKKVKMHEFEHALQTQYNNGTLDIRYRQQYKKIFFEIGRLKNGKYNKEITSFETINKDSGDYETYTHTGLRYSSSSKNRLTYRNVERI